MKKKMAHLKAGPDISIASDMFSVGSIVNKMATGEPYDRPSDEAGFKATRI